MSGDAWPALARSEVLALPAAQRADRLVTFMQHVILALRQPSGNAPVASDRLTELGLNSLQFVELKFALDTVVGEELDIEPFGENPTLQEVAEIAASRLVDG